ncbi:hypothetical protein MarSH_263 [Marseillevirus Shanghai 1]|nr:hypothetical protein MarSH_263 [Marseillevirus Shanghai 1]
MEKGSLKWLGFLSDSLTPATEKKFLTEKVREKQKACGMHFLMAEMKENSKEMNLVFSNMSSSGRGMSSSKEMETEMGNNKQKIKLPQPRFHSRCCISLKSPGCLFPEFLLFWNCHKRGPQQHKRNMKREHLRKR